MKLYILTAITQKEIATGTRYDLTLIDVKERRQWERTLFPRYKHIDKWQPLLDNPQLGYYTGLASNSEYGPTVSKSGLKYIGPISDAEITMELLKLRK